LSGNDIVSGALKNAGTNLAHHQFDSRSHNISSRIAEGNVMYKRTAFITGAALTIMTSAVLAQELRIPVNRDSQNGAQAPRPQRAISQDDVRHDLQQAGFNDIEFLQSAYVVRATNKDGTKLVMTITPESVRAIAGAPSSGAGVSGQAGNKNGPAANSGTQANNQGAQTKEAVRERDSAKIPGKPGSKSGPAVNPPAGEPK
jgi:hypothetical protein